MAEIKTCEQYVLNRLQEKEDTNIYLKSNLECLQQNYDRLHKRMEKIKEILHTYGEVRTFGDDNKKYMVIEINEYKDSEKYAFDKIMRFAHIKDEEVPEVEKNDADLTLKIGDDEYVLEPIDEEAERLINEE